MKLTPEDWQEFYVTVFCGFALCCLFLALTEIFIGSYWYSVGYCAAGAISWIAFVTALRDRRRARS